MGAAAESYSAQSTIPNSSISTSCTTTAFGGRDNQFHQLDVHIGLKLAGNFLQPRPAPPGKPLLERPERAVVPGVGPVITMPDGTEKRVAGSV